MSRYLYILLVLTTFVSCSKLNFYKTNVKPFEKTNIDHRDQAKRFGQILSQYPLIDSAGLKPVPNFVGTTNFSMRKPNFVVIHHTAQKSCAETLKTFTLPHTQVSAHYVICEDGTVYHMLNDYLRAHHAGLGRWGNDTDLNSSSIGIEIDNDGSESFKEAQMQSLLLLLDRLKTAYNIPTANFIGHSDLAPSRKNDPNVTFDWNRLATKGFGVWYGDTTNLVVPKEFDPIIALKIIGYDVKDTKAAITVFKRKYMRKDNSTTLFDDDKKVLYALLKKFL